MDWPPDLHKSDGDDRLPIGDENKTWKMKWKIVPETPFFLSKDVDGRNMTIGRRKEPAWMT